MISDSRFKIHAPRFARGGQAALSLVLLIGSILVVIGVTTLLISTSLVNSIYAFQSANNSLAVATAGVNDAWLQLARNKDFVAVGGYTVPLNDYSALVTVTQNSPTPGAATILAIGTAGSFQSKLKVIVSISSLGRISLLSWQKVAL